MIVVTNSGPLIALAKLGLLYLLKRLYGKIYVPRAVYREVVEQGRSGWLFRCPPDQIGISTEAVDSYGGKKSNP